MLPSLGVPLRTILHIRVSYGASEPFTRLRSLRARESPPCAPPAVHSVGQAFRKQLCNKQNEATLFHFKNICVDKNLQILIYLVQANHEHTKAMDTTHNRNVDVTEIRKLKKELSNVEQVLNAIRILGSCITSCTDKGRFT